MLRDFRLGLRMLRKQRGFAAVAVLTLALGIGATSAVFSLIHGVLLTPPPYESPEDLVLIPAERADGRDASRERRWAASQWLAWQQEAESFDAIAAYMWTFNFLILPDGSQSIEGMLVTGDYFEALGLEPALGRGFSEEELRASDATAILIGHDLWQQAFHGDPDIVGKSVRISRWDTAPTVAGVMPPGVRFLPSPSAAQEPNYNVDSTVDFWVPVSLPNDRLDMPAWDVMGRLRKGTSARQAQEELGLIVRRQAELNQDFEGMVPAVRSLTDELNSSARGILWPLFGAAALVLLIACANAAALLLLRGLGRTQEHAVQRALGGSRAALFRQTAVESLVLATMGGVLGAGIGFGVVRLFQLIGASAIPRLDAVQMGWPVLGWAMAAAAAAALGAGIYPAYRAGASAPMEALKSAGPKSSASPRERRVLRGVTLLQTALTLVLLVGAGLLIRTMVKLGEVSAGYDTSRTLTMTVTALGQDGSWDDFHRRALERVAALPGVDHAAFAWGLPLTGNNWPAAVEIEGQPPAARAADRIALPLRSVTPDYFELLGMEMADGRPFRDSDAQDAPQVVIVNQALADRYFPGEPAIGRKIWLWGREQSAAQVVGVVTDSRTTSLTQEATPEIYLPLWQAHAFSKHLVVRTSGEPRALSAAIQRELRAIDPKVAVENVKTLDAIRGDSLAARSFAMELLIGFAVVAGLLTLVGIYSVLALWVASRQREIAIRVAVGAERRSIQSLVFGECLRLVAGGIAIGAVVSLGVARALRSLLYGVDAGDPVTFGAALLLFAAVAGLACWAPTRRALRVDPAQALRSE
ncbi:MAG: FtsX-like permease family protein [Acidobacteria bacterium]|nr:FtsX-like permease family protein [Acidobacteriota bacterium]